VRLARKRCKLAFKGPLFILFLFISREMAVPKLSISAVQGLICFMKGKNMGLSKDDFVF